MEINGKIAGGPRKVFPFGAYTDETYLTTSGTRTAKPVFAIAGRLIAMLLVILFNIMSCPAAGILSLQCRGATEAWKLIGFIPKLNPAASVAKTKEFRAFKAKFYHECIEVMLSRTVRKYNEDGGFWLKMKPDEPPVLFFPQCSNIIQDMPEVFSNHSTQMDLSHPSSY